MWRPYLCPQRPLNQPNPIEAQRVPALLKLKSGAVRIELAMVQAAPVKAVATRKVHFSLSSNRLLGLPSRKDSSAGAGEGASKTPPYF